MHTVRQSLRDEWHRWCPLGLGGLTILLYLSGPTVTAQWLIPLTLGLLMGQLLKDLDRRYTGWRHHGPTVSQEDHPRG